MGVKESLKCPLCGDMITEDQASSFPLEYKRKVVIQRDGGKCVRCGSTRNLQVHHIKKHWEGGSDHLSNLITLCARCHTLAENNYQKKMRGRRYL
jgi:5-methylcytosine-specific restriction endonuclease McrA